MIRGLNHITLAVSNIETSFRFYHEVMGFRPLCKSEGSAYFLAGEPDQPGCVWFCLDLDRGHVRVPSPCHSHIAFSVDPTDFTAMSKRILDSGAKVFKENTSPGDSLYFLDPDGHKLEIHVGTWKERLEAKRANPGAWKNVVWYE